MRWSDIEDATLRAYYPVHGKNWPGWEDVLPGKSASARNNRARRMGIAESSSQNAVVTKYDTVITLTNCGTPPSEIDRLMGYDAGTAHSAIVELWGRGRTIWKG